MSQPFHHRAPASISDLHERIGRFVATGDVISTAEHTWDARKEYMRGLTIEAPIRRPQPPPRDVSRANVAQINADWLETERLIEAARVEHGFCTPAFRKAYRLIVTRPDAPLLAPVVETNDG